MSITAIPFVPATTRLQTCDDIVRSFELPKIVILNIFTNKHKDCQWTTDKEETIYCHSPYIPPMILLSKPAAPDPSLITAVPPPAHTQADPVPPDETPMLEGNVKGGT